MPSHRIRLPGLVLALVAGGGALLSCSERRAPVVPLTTKCLVSPDSIDFGPLQLRQLGFREIAVTNPGTSSLPLRVRLQPPSYFYLAYVDTGTFQLPPGETKRFTLAYSPQSPGLQSTVIDLGNAVCTQIFCQGEGHIDPVASCEVSVQSLDFPTIRFGESVDLSFMIRNVGTLPISGMITFGCGPFTVISGAGPFSLDPQDSIEATVRFQPTRPGIYHCSLDLGTSVCPSVTCNGLGITGQTWWITPDGTGDAPTIQAGIDSAFHGDTVLVAPGTYYEDIDFQGKGVVLKSSSGPEVTVLDGTGQDSSIVIFKSGETNAAILEGFTITNGSGIAYPGGPTHGGGIFCIDSEPTIKGNVITQNHAVWGGGIDIIHTLTPGSAIPTPRIEGNVISSNVAESGGGGLIVSQANVEIIANRFTDNEVIMEGDGGGIRLRITYGSTATVVNNEILRNIASDQGGGIFVYTDDESGPVVIANNLIAKNLARGIGPDSPTVGSGGGIGTNRLRGIITHNTIAENVALPAGLCSGGGIRVAYPSDELEIYHNIIAGNENCGIACRVGGSGFGGPNILWNNTLEEIEAGSCPASWHQSAVLLDPYFCSPETGDYRVAQNSPALLQGEYFGAFPNPGCGPAAVKPATWGRLKALYR